MLDQGRESGFATLLRIGRKETHHAPPEFCVSVSSDGRTTPSSSADSRSGNSSQRLRTAELPQGRPLVSRVGDGTPSTDSSHGSVLPPRTVPSLEALVPRTNGPLSAASRASGRTSTRRG